MSFQAETPLELNNEKYANEPRSPNQIASLTIPQWRVRILTDDN